MSKIGEDMLKRMVERERQKVKAYERIAKVHSAYISILLNKLGATNDNTITIKTSEVTEAMDKYESRAIPTEDGWQLYCEVIKEE